MNIVPICGIKSKAGEEENEFIPAAHQRASRQNTEHSLDDGGVRGHVVCFLCGHNSSAFLQQGKLGRHRHFHCIVVPVWPYL